MRDSLFGISTSHIAATQSQLSLTEVFCALTLLHEIRDSTRGFHS